MAHLPYQLLVDGVHFVFEFILTQLKLFGFLFFRLFFSLTNLSLSLSLERKNTPSSPI